MSATLTRQIKRQSPFGRLWALMESKGKGQFSLRGKKGADPNPEGNAGSKRGSNHNSGNGFQPGGDPGMQLKDALFVGLVMGTLFALSKGGSERTTGAPRDISMQFFLSKLLAVGEVDMIEVDKRGEAVYVSLVDEAEIDELGSNASTFTYRISVGSVASFERQLEAFQKNELNLDSNDYIAVRYRSSDSGELFDTIITAMIPIVTFGAIYFIMSRRAASMMPKSGGPTSSPSGKTNKNDPFSIGKIGVEASPPSVTRFSDVAGLGEAKVEVMEFVDYLRDPDKFETLGAKVPKGALLTGPPGTGKTLLAKAVSGEAKVPFYSVSGSDFVEMFVGVGASRVRDLFKKARENKPSIIYIDEIDAVGKARKSGNGQGGNQERETTLNQLLVEMDGFNSEKGIIILASTNRVDTLDKALLRPGRFDRQIACDLPSLSEREEIFAVHMQSIVLDKPAEEYIPKLAALTPGMSGAQVANICNEAALFAARRGGETITITDFADAADRIIAGPEKKTRVLASQEKKIVAYHESGHVLTAWLLETMDPLLKTTIVPRTTGALGFAQYLPQDKALHSQQELEDRLVVMLGGRAAEQTRFGSITTGASDDLRRVSEIAYAMLTQYGMSPKVGNLAWPDFPKPEFGYRRASNNLTEIVELEVDQIVRRAYDRAVTMLTEHQDKLEVLAQGLLSRETLDYDDVASLIGPRPFPHQHPYRFKEVEESLRDNGGYSAEERVGASIESPTPAPLTASPVIGRTKKA